MKNLQFKGIITQSTDNTKKYNERSWKATTLTNWLNVHITVCVLCTHTHCTIKYPETTL
jgi:hypothetical protein